MTAIEDARAALADWNARGVHGDPLVVAALRALIAEHERLTSPPTDDEHEALAGIAREAWAHYQAIQDDPEFGGDFEDVLAYRLGLAGFRRQGPITDAQALAAERERAFHRYVLLDAPTEPIQAKCSCGWTGPYAGEWRLHRERAALEAAERAR